MSGRILFYVQHLIGVGHVFRAMRIVRALDAAGFDVDLVYGGEPVPNFDAGAAKVHFLPPLRGGSETFSKLEAPDGTVVGDDYRDRRRDRLLDIFRTAQPDAVVTEAFPFGRRQMRFELLPLLEAAAARSKRPKIVVSVRDILQENRKPERDVETVETLERYFDHVLVHADPHLVRFGKTFPHFGRIRDKVLYTGIVAPEPEDVRMATEAPRFDVVVSVGGGALGRELLFAAAGAKALSTFNDASWCIVTGINTADEDVAALRKLVSDDVVVTPFLPNLGSAIAGAKLSVSRAGYNTLADIFRAGCRAVVVPLSNGEETEQIRRAEYLAEAGLAVTVDACRQTPANVAAAIDRAMAAPAPDRRRIDLDGAPRTAEIMARVLSGGDLSGYR